MFAGGQYPDVFIDLMGLGAQLMGACCHGAGVLQQVLAHFPAVKQALSRALGACDGFARNKLAAAGPRLKGAAATVLHKASNFFAARHHHIASGHPTDLSRLAAQRQDGAGEVKVANIFFQPAIQQGSIKEHRSLSHG